MDVAALSSAMSANSVSMQVGTRVLKMAMNQTQQNADMLTDMMKQMSQLASPHLGRSIDVSV